MYDVRVDFSHCVVIFFSFYILGYASYQCYKVRLYLPFKPSEKQTNRFLTKTWLWIQCTGEVDERSLLCVIRSPTKPWVHSTRSWTSPTRVARWSNWEMRRVTCSWVSIQARRTPSPWEPARLKATVPRPSLRPPPRSQVCLKKRFSFSIVII